MSIQPAIIWHSPQTVFTSSTTKFHALGTKLILPGGRVFYYAMHSNSTTLTRGQLMGQAPVVANHQDRTMTATAGLKTATLAIGATALTADQYADGYMWCDSGTGISQYRIVVSNNASAGSTTETITVDEPWETTLAAATGSLQKNLYRDVVVFPGNSQAQTVVGVMPCTVTDGSTTNKFFWIQTSGPCSVSAEGSLTIGQPLVPATAATSDAGQVKLAVETGATGTLDPLPLVGYVLGPNGTDEHSVLADLRIRS
jgi:hypothetical protein